MEFGKVSTVLELVIIQEKNSKDKNIHKLSRKIIFLQIGAQNLQFCCPNHMFSFVWTVWAVKKKKFKKTSKFLLNDKCFYLYEKDSTISFGLVMKKI